MADLFAEEIAVFYGENIYSFNFVKAIHGKRKAISIDCKKMEMVLRTK